MEYCPEGTLEALVTSRENGLEEPLSRRYTSQLIQVDYTVQFWWSEINYNYYKIIYFYVGCCVFTCQPNCSP